MPLLALAFIVVPLTEVALFVQVGGLIGLWPTLGVILATAVAGAMLVRAQGVAVVARLREALEEFGDPVEPAAHGALILLAGALLLTPGFFTDAVGFALLAPPVRAAILARLTERILAARSRAESTRRAESDIVDAEDWETERDEDSGTPPSQR